MQRRINLYIHEEVWLAFRKACLDQRISASQAIEKLMREQLERWQRPVAPGKDEV